jgi:hypothetical protein
LYQGSFGYISMIVLRRGVRFSAVGFRIYSPWR